MEKELVEKQNELNELQALKSIEILDENEIQLMVGESGAGRVATVTKDCPNSKRSKFSNNLPIGLPC